MRAKRSKQYRKLMHQYELAFNFREPYQVLVDAEIIQAAARFKMRLGQMLENTLHGKIKPMITQCCIRHLYNAEIEGQDQSTKEAWIATAKQAERRRCGHHELEEPLSALECILSVLDPKGSGTNKHRYVVATQEMDVRKRLRQIAGVPLIYINRSVMILEPMGEKTEDVREREEKSKIRAGLKGRRESAGTKRKREEDDGDEEKAVATIPPGQSEQPDQKKRRRARGPKGPNPLSMKKAKKETGQIPKDKASSDTLTETRRASAVTATAEGTITHNQSAATPDASKAADEAQVKRRRKRKPKAAAHEEAHFDEA